MSTDPRRAARMEAATQRGLKLQQLIDVLDLARRYDITHARTNRDDDYLNLLLARDEASRLIDLVLEADLTDYREMLSDEAFSECRYDMAEGVHLDDNGDPVGRYSLPAGYADWRHDVAREFRA